MIKPLKVSTKLILTNKREEKVNVKEFYKDDSIEVWWDTLVKT